MDVRNFFESAEIQNIIQRAEKLKTEKKVFSDVIDNNGNQYVDLVQEGGGVLGIALVGYTFVLEKAGIRFFNLAGASAGAINTLLMASIKEIHQEKSEDILAILSEQSLFDFVDGGKKVKKLIQRAVSNRSIIFTILFSFFYLKRKIVEKFGLNPGSKFERWITEILKENHISTLSDLIKKQTELPELYYIGDNKKEPIVYDSTKIAIIATDTTTKTKVEFPRMAELYWDLTKNDLNPSLFVRASMSIPFFFEPFAVKDIPSNGTRDNMNWQDYAGYSGIVPKEIKFVDGGLLSNFPINIFHLDGIPKKPTLGVRLSAYREEQANTGTLSGFFSGMLDALRQQFDYDFLLKHPDYKNLICKIDADKAYNWLDFNISDKDKIGLFTLGATRAIEFLEKFNWEVYKDIRKKNLKV